MMKRKLIILLAALCSLISVHCSAKLHWQSKMDSLLKELPRQNEDTNKIDILIWLCNAHENINPDEGIKYAQEAIALCTKKGWEAKLPKAYNSLGNCYVDKFDCPKALGCFFKSMELAKKNGDIRGVAITAGNIGIAYSKLSDYIKALEYHFVALKIDEKLGRKADLAADYTNIGLVYSEQGDYKNALEYCFKALRLDEEMGYKNGIAADYCSIGAIYNQEGDNEKALEYLFTGLKAAEGVGNRRFVGNITANIGTVYDAQHEHVRALTWHFRALRIGEEIGDKAIEGGSLSGIGGSYIGLVTHPRSAVTVTDESELPVAQYELDAPIPKGRSALLHRAVEYLKRAVVINEEVGDLCGLQKSYEYLSEAYTLLGKYKAALEASDYHHALKDSVFSQENKEEILKMSMKNDYDRQRLTDSLKVAEDQKIARVNLKKQKSYTYAGIAGVLLLGGFSFFVFKERRKSEAERKKSDGLLLNILPEAVAQELKAKGVTSAKHYDNVTVLFTDFVNFTQASESMNPQALIDELHTCFKKFDEISEQYNIEKIKTIGDAYLAVAGLPTADPEHAQHVVSAAKEITEFMTDRLAKLGRERTFEVRVGIHSGSVVAGVVGVKKFAYDIWGDTVNTAARMEQNGEAGKINISQTTYELVKDKFACEYRGEVEAKGKGVMKMYYVS